MEVEYLILADAAQVQGEKLYLLGGGWSYVWAREFPVTHPIAAALGILVDWNETNRRHPWSVVVRNEETGQVVASVEGEFEQGRPPGIPPGAPQRIQIALNLAAALGAPGDFAVDVRIDGETMKSVAFKALQRMPSRETLEARA